MSTDKDWKKWGAQNPYYGVISSEKFLSDNLNTQAIAEFYKSGTRDIDSLKAWIGQLDPKFKPMHAVDFGCGAGRLTLPLAKYATKATGLDVSPEILKLANAKLGANSKNKVEFCFADDSLSNLPDKFDLVYSNIVLQHIPPRRGYKLTETMLSGLSEGGIAALQFTYKHEAPAIRRAVIWARGKSILIHYAANILTRRPANSPRMRMHLYNLERLQTIFEAAGITKTLHIATDHGGYKGVMIIGKKG